MSELFVPISVRDELEEERERKLAAFMRQDFPVSFSTVNQGVPLGIGGSQTAQTLLTEQKGWADIAGRVISDRVGGIKWFAGELVEGDDGKLKPEPLPLVHPLNVLLRRPNPVLSGMLAKILNARLIVQTGAAYWQKIRDGIGVVRELWPIPTQNIDPIAKNGMLIGAYRVTGSDGRQYELDIEDVVRVWYPDAFNIYGQRGRLIGQATEYDAERFLVQHMRAFFEKDATPRVAIVGDQGSSVPKRSDMDAFLSRWRQANDRRLGTEIGLPAFIPPGFKPHQFDTNTGTSDMVGWDDQWSEQILAAYGVSKFSVGIDTNVNRATAEASMFAQDQNTVKPITDLISDHYSHQLAQTEFDESFGVFFEDFIAADKEFELAQETADIRSKVRSPNEIREARDLDPAPWGENPPGTLADEPYTGAPAFDAGALPRERINLSTRADVLTADGQWERNLRVERERAPQWARQMQKVFEVQLEDTLVRLANAMGVDMDALRSTGFHPAAALSRISVDEVFVADIWGETFDNIIEPLRSEILTASAEVVQLGLAPELEFNLTSFMTSQLDTQAANYVVNINGTTQQTIQRMLAAATENGDSVSQIASALEGIFRNKARSITIARTEVGMANQAGVIAGFYSSGVVRGKQWNTSRNAAVRDSHEIDGQQTTLDGFFTLRDGVQARFPLDPRLPPEDSISCRCFVTPITLDTEEQG